MLNPAAIKVSILDKVRQSVPFFKNFGLEELKAILRNCQQVSYPSGSYIIREGELSDKMYIVIQGEVEVSRSLPGGDEVLCVLQAGECFGEMGIIEKTRRSATVKAVSDCLLLAVSQGILGKVNPIFTSRLYRNFTSILSERLRKTLGLVEELQAERDRLRKQLERLEAEKLELKSRVEEFDARPQSGGHWARAQRNR